MNDYAGYSRFKRSILCEGWNGRVEGRNDYAGYSRFKRSILCEG